MNSKHRIVIVGGGFGGLAAAHALKGADVAITLIDKRNHHLFQPLLYQVATAALSPAEIAWPIRHLMRGRGDVQTLLGEVSGVDRAAHQVMLADGKAIGFDSLIIATGAEHAYFGHDDWASLAPGLKTLEDATHIRSKLLTAFERAELEPDAKRRAALLTFILVGGGPTGVELAGALAELSHQTLRGEFRAIDSAQARIVLIEAGPRLLPGFRAEQSDEAIRRLTELGVEVRLNQAVSSIAATGVVVDRTEIAADTILWAAGVAASPAAQWLDAEADRAGRVKVAPDLSLPGAKDIFVIGDTMALVGANDQTVPGVADAAKQAGRYVGQVIVARLKGGPVPAPFVFHPLGRLATIGGRAAIADLGVVRFNGRVGWWVWALAHIYFLIGLRYRLIVALNWFWIYVVGQRGARLITQGEAGGEKRRY